MIEPTGPLRAAALVITVAFAVTISPTMASAAVTDVLNKCTNVDSTAPSLPDFLKAARPLNPSYSDEQIKREWVRTYKDCTLHLKVCQA